MRLRRKSLSEQVAVDPRDQLVLEEARRRIDQQKKDLEGLRNRAGSTAGYATVVASVLGGLSLRNNAQPTEWTWAGLGALVVAAASCVFVLWPRKLSLSLDVKTLDDRIDEGHDIARMMRDTSLGLVKDHGTNQRRLNRLHNAYVVSLVAVQAEVGLLLLDLVRR